VLVGAGPDTPRSIRPFQQPHCADDSGRDRQRERQLLPQIGVESVREGCILQDHRHRGMNQDEGAEIQKGWEATEQPRHELAAEEDDRNREQQAEHEQADISVRRAGNRQNVIQTHDDVGQNDGLDRLPQGTGFFDLAVFIPLRPQELVCDVKEQDTTDRLQLRNTEENGGQGGKENAQTDRADAAKDDRLAAILHG
jgi:hypothetical protein